MKFKIVVIHQQDAHVNSGGDRIEIVSNRDVNVSIEEAARIPEAEAYLERLLGMRVHLDVVSSD